MEQSPENQNIPDYTLLKTRILSGNLSLVDAKKTLIAWDQATSSHDAAETNLTFLLDPEIKSYIANTSPDIQKNYNLLLSFTEFHVAQKKISTNQEEALSHFENALRNAQESDGGASWSTYIEGTLLYLNGKEIPEEMISVVEQTKNAPVLRRFNIGLKTRGLPSYTEDYTDTH